MGDNIIQENSLIVTGLCYQYQWIEPEEEQPAKQQKPKRRATKVLNNSAGRKTIIKVQ